MPFNDPYGYIGNSSTLNRILWECPNFVDYTGIALRASALAMAKELKFDIVVPAELLDLAEALRITAEFQQADAAYYKRRENLTEAKSCKRDARRLLVMARHLEHEADDGKDRAYTALVESPTKVIALKAGLKTYFVAAFLWNAGLDGFDEAYDCLVRHGLIGVVDQPTDADMADAYRADADIADAQTAESQTADSQTADSEAADSEAADAETADAETADAETADADTADADTAYPPSTFLATLELATKLMRRLVPPPPRTVEEHEKMDEEFLDLASDVEGILPPGDKRSLTTKALSHVKGIGKVRQDRNREAHQVLFSTFLTIAEREFERIKERDATPSKEWQDFFDLFDDVHGFSLGDAQSELPAEYIDRIVLYDN